MLKATKSMSIVLRRSFTVFTSLNLISIMFITYIFKETSVGLVTLQAHIIEPPMQCELRMSLRHFRKIRTTARFVFPRQCRVVMSQNVILPLAYVASWYVILLPLGHGHISLYCRHVDVLGAIEIFTFSCLEC